MFYQSILPDSSPYVVKTSGFTSGFPDHRHADVEIHYCISGSFDAVVDKQTYTVNGGDLLFVGPMVSHMFPTPSANERRVLTVILGVSFLKEYFSSFSGSKSTTPLLSLSSNTPEAVALSALLTETAELCEAMEKKELLIRGNLYKICSYLIDLLCRPADSDSSSVKLRAVANIDRALELTYYNYADPITVDDAARLTGYSKSSFCRVFRDIVGDTFHNVLNRQRIKAAEGLLTETDTPIGEIGTAVGFPETKTFCRVFKSAHGLTPGEYRKKSRG